MVAYLTSHPPAVSQWYKSRSRSLTGCTVLHTAEGVLDSIGVDTGAENVANFIRTRTTSGSYHDLVDSDSGIHLVEYHHGAYHDGTGSNNWALSLSFACATHHWRSMSAQQRAGFLRQGALRFVAQQKWRQANGAPLTRLRLISKAQSDAGESGFTYHGFRDPGRRSDPGVASPNLFPMSEFLAACKTALGELMPDHPDAPEDDMPTPREVADEVLATPLGVPIVDERGDTDRVIKNATVRDVLTMVAFQVSRGAPGVRHAGPLRLLLDDAADEDNAPGGV